LASGPPAVVLILLLEAEAVPVLAVRGNTLESVVAIVFEHTATLLVQQPLLQQLLVQPAPQQFVKRWLDLLQLV
jgi:hypothetical protein